MTAKSKGNTKGSTTKAEGGRVRKSALIIPTLSIKGMAEGDTLAIRAEGEIFSKPATNDDGSPKIETKGPRKGEQAYLHLLNVTNLDTGELGQMVLPCLVHNALAEYAKENGGLAGACFELVKGRAESNKATKWEVYEIEIKA